MYATGVKNYEQEAIYLINLIHYASAIEIVVHLCITTDTVKSIIDDASDEVNMKALL